MTTETPRDQPNNVATEDAPRPPDNSVVTSDLPPQEPESRAADTATPPAAADGDDKSHGTNYDQASAAGDDKKAQPRNRSAERRIKKLSSKLSRAAEVTAAQQREIDRLARENTQLKASQAETPEPKLEDFKTPAEYAKAYGKWESAQKAAKPSDTPATPASDPNDQPTVDDTAIRDFHEAGRKMLGDEFAEALEEKGTAVSQVMADYLFDSDLGPAIYVHLANNQDDSREIYDMSAPKAIKALEELAERAQAGQLDIEGQLQVAPPPGDDKKSDNGKPKNPGGTKAPTPPSSTKEPGNPITAPNPDDEDMEAYAARRQKEEARRMGYNV